MARCRSPFKSLEFFVFCHGVLQLALLLVSGFMKGGIPTLERRYGFSSTESGLLSGFNEVGSLLLIMFVSFLGSRVHRPKFIGAGALLCSLASMLVTLPHFLGDLYTYTDHDINNNSTNSGLCQALNTTLPPDEGCTSQEHTAQQWIYPLMLMAQLLLGIGTVPIQPFGISYLDDFASKKASPIYLGVLLAVGCFGPALGFLVGGFTLSYYVDFDKLSPDEIKLNPRDPRFVGAWWLGFLGSAILLFITALPYMFFPREMPKEDDDEDDDPKTEEQPAAPKPEETFTQFLKSFPRIALRTLRSPVFLLVVFAQVCMTALVVGVATFMGKFIEKQFSLSFSFANMMIGGVVIPFAVLGILLGGGLMRKLNLSLTGAGKLCSAVVFLAVCTAIPLLFMGCPTQKVGGITQSYDPATCNADCTCPTDAYNPICGADGVEFRSPCHAGCESMVKDGMDVKNYTECSCVNGGHALPGSCGSDCTHLLPYFMGLAAVTCFLASTSQTPSFMMVLRVVPPEDKSFAVGVQHFLWRVLAFLPGPVLYGTVIDTTCILWGERCGDQTSCLYYDMTDFRHRFLGVQLSFIIGGLIFFVLSMLVVRRQARNEPPLETKKETPMQTKTEKAVETKL